MTTCIAAKVGGSNPALVFCMDMKGSQEWSSSETTYKWITFGNFHALIAGPTSVAKEVANYCAEAVCSIDKVKTQTQVANALRKGLGRYKASVAEATIQSQLGISYEEFRQRGKDAFPADLCRSISWEIKNYRSGAEVIFSGFLPFDKHANIDDPACRGYRNSRWPHIFKVSDTSSSSSVMTCDDFATIGSGSYLAEGALLYRSQNYHYAFASTVYNCYEAKRMSERADGVGERTKIVVVYKDNKACDLQLRGMEILKAAFVRFSPQIVCGIEMPKELFMDVVGWHDPVTQ
jgi:hypothetical protein